MKMLRINKTADELTSMAAAFPRVEEVWFSAVLKPLIL